MSNTAVQPREKLIPVLKSILSMMESNISKKSLLTNITAYVNRINYIISELNRLEPTTHNVNYYSSNSLAF